MSAEDFEAAAEAAGVSPESAFRRYLSFIQRYGSTREQVLASAEPERCFPIPDQGTVNEAIAVMSAIPPGDIVAVLPAGAGGSGFTFSGAAIVSSAPEHSPFASLDGLTVTAEAPLTGEAVEELYRAMIGHSSADAPLLAAEQRARDALELAEALFAAFIPDGKGWYRPCMMPPDDFEGLRRKLDGLRRDAA